MIIWGSTHTRWIAAITALFIIFYAWNAQEHNFKTTLPKQPSNEQADTQLVNVVRKEFNTQGELDNTLTSPQITVFEKQGFSLIKHPELKTFTQQKTHWTLRSEKAKLSQNQSVIELIDHVVAQNSIDITVIKSPYIHLEQDTQNISSDQTVSLIKHNATLNAIGLKGNLKTHYLHLESQVKGQYYDVK